MKKIACIISDKKIKKFSDECYHWKDYKSIDDYIEDIVPILVYSSRTIRRSGQEESVKNEKNILSMLINVKSQQMIVRLRSDLAVDRKSFLSIFRYIMGKNMGTSKKREEQGFQMSNLLQEIDKK